MDVVDGFYENYYGKWNDGFPYFASPKFFVGNGVDVTGEWLEKQLKQFWDAYMFLQGNIHIMGEDSIMELLGLRKEGNVSNEEIEK